MIPFAFAWIISYLTVYLYAVSIAADPALQQTTIDEINKFVADSRATGDLSTTFTYTINQGTGIINLGNSVFGFIRDWVIGIFTWNTWNIPGLFERDLASGYTSGGYYIKQYVLEPMSIITLGFVVRYIMPFIRMLISTLDAFIPF